MQLKLMAQIKRVEADMIVKKNPYKKSALDEILQNLNDRI